MKYLILLSVLSLTSRCVGQDTARRCYDTTGRSSLINAVQYGRWSNGSPFFFVSDSEGIPVAYQEQDSGLVVKDSAKAILTIIKALIRDNDYRQKKYAESKKPHHKPKKMHAPQFTVDDPGIMTTYQTPDKMQPPAPDTIYVTSIQMADGGRNLYDLRAHKWYRNEPWYSGDHWWKWLGFWIGCAAVLMFAVAVIIAFSIRKIDLQ